MTKNNEFIKIIRLLSFQSKSKLSRKTDKLILPLPFSTHPKHFRANQAFTRGNTG